jgi:ubiquinone/menaquinone biosynthesis C-methylase UbiE
MIFLLKKLYFQLQIKYLIIFKPTVLFDRINNLVWYKSMLSQWVDDQNFIANSKLLEVGCATGTLTRYIATLDHIPTGVDYSIKMIELAQTSNMNIKFSVASVLDLPFENASFDAVIAASLINIVADKNKAIDELFRTCKKGGIVTILVPSTPFNDNDLHSLQASLDNSGFSFSAMKAWHNLAPKMDTSDISHLFKQAGLTKITTQKYLQGMVVSISGIKPL